MATKYSDKFEYTPFVCLECFLNHIVPMISKMMISIKTKAPAITPPMIPPMIVPDKVSSF